MSYEKKSIEQPVVTVDDFYGEEKALVVHSHINEKGKMILNREEASLLLVELHKFIKSEESRPDVDETDHEDWANVSYRMNNEGFDYCWRSYSEFLEIKDPYFHALRKNYIKAATDLESYVDQKNEETNG